MTLTPSGSLNVTTDGTVIDSKDVSGTITISASNVTIKRCRVTSGSYFPVYVTSGSNILIEDVEVDGQGGSSKGIMISSGSVTITRVNIHDSEDGLHISGSGPILLQDSYIHNPRSAPSGHQDGMEIENTSKVTISHNNVDYAGANASAIMIDNYFGADDGVTVDGNWLGGGAFMIYVDGGFNTSPLSNVHVTNNRFIRGSSIYGLDVVRGSTPGFVWSNNVYDDNSQIINP